MILRLRLQKMTEELPVEQHPGRLEALRTEFGHTIKIVDSEIPIGGYTCGVHSFSLVNDPTYLEVASFGFGKTFAGADFINFLLYHGLIEEKLSEAATVDDLVLYFDGVAFKHVGKVSEGGRTLSKWGQGYLFDHPVWEVPSDYGKKVRYFMGLNPEQGLNLFITYAKSKGFNFKV